MRADIASAHSQSLRSPKSTGEVTVPRHGAKQDLHKPALDDFENVEGVRVTLVDPFAFNLKRRQDAPPPCVALV